MTPVRTSFAIAVNQRQLVLSDHEVLYVLQRMEILDLLESKTTVTIQFAFSERVCNNQVGYLRTDCAFSQLESEPTRNSGMCPVKI